MAAEGGRYKEFSSGKYSLVGCPCSCGCPYKYKYVGSSNQSQWAIEKENVKLGGGYEGWVTMIEMYCIHGWGSQRISRKLTRKINRGKNLCHFPHFSRLALVCNTSERYFREFQHSAAAKCGKCYYIKPSLGYETGGIFEVSVNTRL